MILKKLFAHFTKPREKKGMKWLAIAALAVMLLVNGLANGLKIGGNSTGEVSDAYPNLFAPAGVTFSIWGVIYLLLIGFAVYQFAAVRVRAGSKLPEKLFSRIAPLFIVTSLVNAAWMFAWHFRVIWLSVVLMVVLLVTLIKIVEQIRTQCGAAKTNVWDYLLVKLPFMVYFGWITVATIANITTWLVSTGWNGGGIKPAVLLGGVLVVGAVICLAAIVRHRDPSYGAVFVWAYGGILIKHMSEQGFNGEYPSVIILLSVLISVLASVSLTVGLRKGFDE